jgi:hypothetical protein
MVRKQSDFSPDKGTMEQPNSQNNNANKALLGTRHKVSGPQNADVQRPENIEKLR